MDIGISSSFEGGKGMDGSVIAMELRRIIYTWPCKLQSSDLCGGLAQLTILDCTDARV